MSHSTDTDANARFAEYARPEVLVSTDWLAEHLDDPNVVILESDEDLLLYELGHIPGALKLDSHRLVRHQDTWWRKNPRLIRIDLSLPEATAEVSRRIAEFLATNR